MSNPEYKSLVDYLQLKYGPPSSKSTDFGKPSFLWNINKGKYELSIYAADKKFHHAVYMDKEKFMEMKKRKKLRNNRKYREF